MSLRMTINKHLWSSCLIQLKIDTQAVKTKGIFFRKWIYSRIFSQIDYGCITIKNISHFLHKDKMENKIHCHHTLSRVRWQLRDREISSLWHEWGDDEMRADCVTYSLNVLITSCHWGNTWGTLPVFEGRNWSITRKECFLAHSP